MERHTRHSRSTEITCSGKGCTNVVYVLPANHVIATKASGRARTSMERKQCYVCGHVTPIPVGKAST